MNEMSGAPYKFVEFFSGTQSVTRRFAAHGFDTVSVDSDARTKPDMCIDVLGIDPDNLPERLRGADVIWASPPCVVFSPLTIGKNWNRDHTPKTDKARHAIKLLHHTVALMKASGASVLWIENPRGKMRRMPILSLLNGWHKRTVTYCQYGDVNMKPTDIWTNIMGWNPRPACRQNMPCHTAAPRGSLVGTQCNESALYKGIVPPALCEEIVRVSLSHLKQEPL